MKRHRIFISIFLFWLCILFLATLKTPNVNISMSFLTTAITMFICGASYIIHQAVDCFFDLPKTKDEAFIGAVIKVANFFFALGYFVYIFLIDHSSVQTDLLHEISRIVLNVCTILLSMSVTAQQVLSIFRKYEGES